MRSTHGHPIVLVGVTALSACDGCHEGKPYTPYSLTDLPSPTPTLTAARLAGGAVDGGTFALGTASAPPGSGMRWPLAGGAAEPPAGHAFAQGLVLDADEDGTPDLLAWSRAPDGLRGELWFASGQRPSEGRLIAALPDGFASIGCNPQVSLQQVSVRLAVLDFDPHCTSHRAAHWIVAVRLTGSGPEIGLEIRMGVPLEGESLRVAIDGSDRDGDGRGDFAASITLAGAPQPMPSTGSATATLAYLDRPAGLSRDPSEPTASFKAMASALMAEGRRKSSAPRVPAAAISARRLQALLCEEGNSKPLITTTAGPIRCGGIHLQEDSAIAEVEAALNLGEPIAALTALARLDALGVRRKDVDTLVAKSVPSIPGHLVRTTAAEPDLKRTPSFGPIAFLPAGDVLVRTREGVIRVDPGSFEESRMEVPPAWPSAVSWLSGVEAHCDAAVLVGRFKVDSDTSEAALPIATPWPCTASSSLPVTLLGGPAPMPLFAVGSEVVAAQPASARFVIPESLAPGVGPSELGVARSPNGAFVAVPSSRGILVVALKGSGRGGTARLWTMPSVDNAAACVPANGGERIACVVAKGAGIYDAR